MGQTAAAVYEKAKPDPNGDRLLGDGNGLFLRIRPHGTKTWVIEYEFKGRRTKYTIGGYLRDGAPGETLADRWANEPNSRRLCYRGDTGDEATSHAVTVRAAGDGQGDDQATLGIFLLVSPMSPSPRPRRSRYLARVASVARQT